MSKRIFIDGSINSELCIVAADGQEIKYFDYSDDLATSKKNNIASFTKAPKIVLMRHAQFPHASGKYVASVKHKNNGGGGGELVSDTVFSIKIITVCPVMIYGHHNQSIFIKLQQLIYSTDLLYYFLSFTKHGKTDSL